MFKKVIFIFVACLLLTISILCATIMLYRSSIVEGYIHKIAESNNMIIELQSDLLNTSEFNASNIIIYDKKTKNKIAEAKSLNIKYDIFSIITKFFIDSYITATGFKVFVKNDVVIDTDIYGSYINDFSEKKSSLALVSNNYHNDLDISKSLELKMYAYKDQVEIFAHFAKSEESYLNAVCSIQNGNYRGQIMLHELPIQTYKILYNLRLNENILDFVKNYIYEGNISGELYFNLNKQDLLFEDLNDITHNKLNGNFLVDGVVLKYDKNYDPIRELKSKIDLSGLDITTSIISGKVYDSQINSGTVLLSMYEEKPVVYISGNMCGEAQNLTNFILDSTLSKLKAKKLDLKSVKGTANVNTNIEIPLDNNQAKYNINLELQNVEWFLFDKKVKLTAKRLDGQLNEKLILIHGDCFINDNQSHISFKHNETKGAKNYNILKIDSQVKNLPFDYKDAFKIDGGTISTHMTYKDTSKKSGVIKLTGDLSNASINIPLLGLNKTKGELGNFKIYSDLSIKEYQKFDVNLDVINKFSINANVDLYNNYNKANIHINNFGYENHISIYDDSSNTKVSIDTDFLDFSRLDLFSLVQKNSDKREKNLDVTVHIKSILMKNNIYFTNIAGLLECDRNSCSKGKFKANIGTRQLFVVNDETENWLIHCSNAGAMLRAIGVYDKIKAGNLGATFNTRNNTINFYLKKFVMVDNSLQAQMISLVSFPGLMKSFSTGNTKFTKMGGKISFNNGLVLMKKIFAEGPHFDFTMHGDVDTTKREINLKGTVTPSLFGLNFFIKKSISKLLFKNNRHGLIFAPYSIKDKY